MDKNKIALIAAGVSIGFTIVQLTAEHYDQKKIRRRIKANGAAEVEAILASVRTVKKKMDQGDYRGKTFQDALSDQRFYEIAYHLENE